MSSDVKIFVASLSSIRTELPRAISNEQASWVVFDTMDALHPIKNIAVARQARVSPENPSGYPRGSSRGCKSKGSHRQPDTNFFTSLFITNKYANF